MAATSAQRIRVCYVVLGFRPKIGGAEIRGEKQARALRARGHEVIVVTVRLQRDWPAAETIDGMRVIRVGGIFRPNGSLRVGRAGIWPVMLGTARELWHLRRQYDVIHVLDYSPLAAAAALVSRLARKPLVVSFQNTGARSELLAYSGGRPSLLQDTLPDDSLLGLDTDQRTVAAVEVFHLQAVAGPALAWLIRAVKPTYQTLSRRGRTELLSRGFAPDRVVHIPGGVDTDLFRPPTVAPPGAAPRSGDLQSPAPTPETNPAARDRTILSVARLDYLKGIDVLLHAWARLMREPSDWRHDVRPRLLLAGDGRLRNQLESIAAVLGITDSVDFLGERSDVLALLQSAWGFVLPSRIEGMPNALLEAMACGLPCVATRVSGSEDIVDDGVDGLLVEPEQPAQMAEALRTILENPELARDLGERAREKVMHEYALGGVIDDCVALYERLAHGDGSRAIETARETAGG